MEKKRLVVISIDSMVTEDLAVLKKLKNFSQLLKESSVILRNEATYPTFTHSIHTSIATGCYPGKHGVIGNEFFQPGNMTPTWFDRIEDVKVPLLPVLAKKNGYSVACVFWPLTMNAPLDYVLYRKEYYGAASQKKEQIKARSTEGLFDEIYPVIKDAFDIEPIRVDDQICGDACAYLIDHYQPDVIYTHLVAIDSIRHQKGVFGEHIIDTYEFLDGVVGEIIDALKRNGLYDKTIINVTADHGHLDIDRVVSINRFLKDKGFISVNEKGELLDWNAYMHSCALSGHVYVKNNDPIIMAEVMQLLEQSAPLLDIEKIYTKAEIEEKYHLKGDFAFVIESNGAATFSADYNAPLCVSSGGKDYRYAVSTHGHEPFKGVQPTYFIRNPYSDRQRVIAKGRVIDQAPTLAKMLGFDMLSADGVPMQELL